MLRKDNEPMKAVRIRVWGHVQGVFYRMFVQESAIDLNVKGYVKNRDEDQVEIIAEGRESNMEKFIQKCREGSEMAFVKRVMITEIEVQDFESFRVRH